MFMGCPTGIHASGTLTSPTLLVEGGTEGGSERECISWLWAGGSKVKYSSISGSDILDDSMFSFYGKSCL